MTHHLPLYIQNRVASNANFALSRFTRDVNELESIQSSNESEVVFTIGAGTSMVYRLTGETLQSCSGSCESEEDFGELVRNVSVGADDSHIRYYGDSMTSWDGVDVDEIKLIELVLVLTHPDGQSAFSTIIYPST